MLEAYSLKLERQLADLSKENGLLQHAVETLQQQHVTPVRGEVPVRYQQDCPITCITITCS